MNINYGFDIEAQKTAEQDPRTWRFGASAIIENINLDDLDWRKYFSNGVPQLGVYFDTMACVSFSAVRIQEAIFNYKIAHDMISAANLKWLNDNGYIDENGQVNFSERYIAKLSGTTHSGNSGWAVAEAIKKYGLVPNFKWPFPDKQRTPVFDWDDYYSEIPAELLALGQEFKARFSFFYETIATDTASLKSGLRHSPIQVYAHAWNAPVNGVYQRTEAAINHAIANAHPEWDIMDHYVDPVDGDWEKKLAANFLFFPTGYKYVWIENNIEDMKFYKTKDSNTVYVLGKGDGLYHAIYSGKVALDVFAKSWEEMNIEVIAIPAEKIGYPIAGIL